MIEFRSLTLRGATESGLRIALFEDREHVVVPVVALVEGVVHAVNAETPELILAEEFSRSRLGWNGEPVVMNHPAVDGKPASANSPEILHQYQLGRVFGTKVDSKKLRMEAWIDPAKVQKVGLEAQQLLENLQKGGTAEVSVGVFVTAEKKNGSYNGRSYTAVWRNLIPDHLAFLSLGSTGACSNEAGCGAGVSRSAMVHLVTAEGISLENDMKEEETPKKEEKSLRERLLSLFQFKSAAGPEDKSDIDLRKALDRALFSTVPAYAGIDAVFPADNLVVFAAVIDETYKVFQQKYSVGENGEVSLQGKREEVEPVTRYEPVTAEAKPSCGCGSKVPEVPESVVFKSEGVAMHKNAERITALIANPKTPWSEHDREHLQNQSDERLTALEAQASDSQPAPTPTPPPPAPAPTPTPEPKAEPKTAIKFEDLPKDWQAAITATQEAEAARVAKHITNLAASQTVYTEDELRAMTGDQLDKIAQLVGVKSEPADFSAATGARAAKDESKEAPKPIDMNERIRQLAGKAS